MEKAIKEKLLFILISFSFFSKMFLGDVVMALEQDTEEKIHSNIKNTEIDKEKVLFILSILLVVTIAGGFYFLVEGVMEIHQVN